MVDDVVVAAGVGFDPAGERELVTVGGLMLVGVGLVSVAGGLLEEVTPTGGATGVILVADILGSRVDWGDMDPLLADGAGLAAADASVPHVLAESGKEIESAPGRGDQAGAEVDGDRALGVREGCLGEMGKAPSSIREATWVISPSVGLPSVEPPLLERGDLRADTGAEERRSSRSPRSPKLLSSKSNSSSSCFFFLSGTDSVISSTGALFLVCALLADRFPTDL